MTLVRAAPAVAPSTLSAAERLADLAVFRSGFMALDRAYSPDARVEAERRLTRLERTKGPMAVAEFLVALCQIAALADNGHSACFYPRSSEVTLTFAPVAGDFHVLAAPQAHADVLGARLVALEARPMSSIRPMVRSLFGGVPARRDLQAADILARPEYLRALGLARAHDAATYRLATRSGQTVERRLTVSERSPAWLRLPSKERTPWAFEDPEQPFRWRDAPEFDAVMAQLRRNADAPNQPIAQFLETVEAARGRLGRRNVVLDMRQNTGGDFLTTRDFMLSWPKRVVSPGRFFVLVGPMTFSAGIASVAYLKQVGGDRVTLIGEPPGDRMMFFAEGRPTRLPSTGAEVSPAGQRDDFATGCRGYSDCFAAIAQPGSPTGTPPELTARIDEKFGRWPLMMRSLDPDIPAPWTIADYELGRDPALQAVAARSGLTRER